MYIITKLIQNALSNSEIIGQHALYKDAAKELENFLKKYENNLVAKGDDEILIEEDNGDIILFKIFEIPGNYVLIEGLTNVPVMNENLEIKVFDEDEIEQEMENYQDPVIAQII